MFFVDIKQLTYCCTVNRVVYDILFGIRNSFENGDAGHREEKLHDKTKPIADKKVLPVIVSCSLILTGCGLDELKIFEDENEKFQAKPISNTDLKNDVYYIKTGTKFYPTYEVNISTGDASIVDNSSCVYVFGEYNNTIPTYFRNELIAYASKENTIDDVSVGRYRDSGYSIGIYNADFDDGYIRFDLNSDVVKESDAVKKFSNRRSNEIMVETINGQKVSGDMLNKAGVFVGFEKDKTYDITFYAGTYYGEISVVADTHFFQPYEAYKLDDHEITKNGYIAIRMPKDAKSGYYIIQAI